MKKVKVFANTPVSSSILKPAQRDGQIKASCRHRHVQHRHVHHRQFSRLQRIEGFGLLVGNEFVHYANVNEYKTYINVWDTSLKLQEKMQWLHFINKNLA